MSATLVVRHKVNNYASWRPVYEQLEPLRAQYGCTDKKVLKSPDNANDLLVTHEFPSLAQAKAFAEDPDLRVGMQRGGVAGAPRIEIYSSV